MPRQIHSYTRLVFWLKILLPIVALGILSTLFLFARTIDLENLLPYAQVEIDKLAADPRLTTPEYNGVTRGGASVRVTADSAWPGKDPASPMTAKDVTAYYEPAQGAKITIRSLAGIFDSIGNKLTLTENVVADSADGYRLTADQAFLSLKDDLLTADGNVIVTGPFGRIEAGAMQLSGPENAHLLVFNKGVRVIYTPKN